MRAHNKEQFVVFWGTGKDACLEVYWRKLGLFLFLAALNVRSMQSIPMCHVSRWPVAGSTGSGVIGVRAVVPFY